MPNRTSTYEVQAFAKLSYKIPGKQYWSAAPGLLYIDVPPEVLDEQVTVIAVLLDGPIDLYSDQSVPGYWSAPIFWERQE